MVVEPLKGNTVVNRTLGKRTVGALLVLVGGGAAGLLGVWVLDVSPALVVVGTQTLGFLVVSLLVWDQSSRVRRELREAEKRIHERLAATARESPAPCSYSDVLPALDEHEERLIRYLDAMRARLEVQGLRGARSDVRGSESP